MTRTRLVTAGVAIALVAAALYVAVNVVTGPSPGPTAVVGEIADFPEGQIVPVDVQIEPGAVVAGGPPMLFIVNHPDTGLLALWARDPHRGCRVTALSPGEPIDMPLEPGAAFLNPCHGEQYALDGSWLSGPSPRGLDRFAVDVLPDGEVVVDATGYQTGAPVSP